MRTRVLLVAMLATAMVMSIAAPTAVAAKKAEVGDRINVLIGTDPTLFDANTPFHVKHGWGLEKGQGPYGAYLFELEIAGTFVDFDYKTSEKVIASDGTKLRQLFWVHNFAHGLPAGSYEFTGTWYAPCVRAVTFPGPCPTPVTPVVEFTRTITVIFS